MIITEKQVVTVEATINAPVEKVWEIWTTPRHIQNWNQASDDWFTPHAENDVHVGGKFRCRMEARDGSSGFDFEGEYSRVEPNKFLEYYMSDGRKVQITFTSNGNQTVVTEKFDAEETNPVDLQKQGWQAILNNFKRYAEASQTMDTLHYEIIINAPAEKVFQTMLGQEYWNEWTYAFNPTSQFKGNWEKGSRMAFLGIEEDGSTSGMVSKIRENIPNKFISIEHIGILKNDQELTSGPEVEGWAGALENYFFKEENGKTNLIIDVDTNREFKAYMEETWPKALNKLKEICERN